MKELKEMLIESLNYSNDLNMWFRSLPNDEIEKIMNYDFSRSSKSTGESFLDAYR